MPPSKNGYTLEILQKKVMAKATKSPKTAAELAERMDIPGYDGRAIGRTLAVLVRDGKLSKSADRKPKYAKVG